MIWHDMIWNMIYKIKINDILYDKWYMVHEKWYMVHDKWYMVHDKWYIIYDKW